jgi:hypothetical protein
MKKKKDGSTPITPSGKGGTNPPSTPSSSKGSKPISGRTLRELGEKADATRTKPLALIRRLGVTDTSRYDLVPIADAQKLQASGTAEIIDTVVTSSRISPRKWMEINVSVQGKPVTISRMKEADAAFWSESAADKFLWPYYEGMRIWDEDYLPRLKKAFQDSIVVGLIHVGLSEMLTVNDSARVLLVIDGTNSMFEGKQVLTLEEFEAFRRR